MRNYVELVDLEQEEESKKEATDELQRRKEVKIVTELYRHPWYIKLFEFLIFINVSFHFIGTIMTN